MDIDHPAGTAVISAETDEVSNFCLKFQHGGLWEFFLYYVKYAAKSVIFGMIF